MNPDQKKQREKAYNQGCMWGLGGGDSNRCPYTPEDPLTEWWFQGWEAGIDAWNERNHNSTSARQA